MGQAKGSDGAMSKIVACQTNGIWAPVPNDANLADSLSTFSDYWALGLGTEVGPAADRRTYTCVQNLAPAPLVCFCAHVNLSASLAWHNCACSPPTGAPAGWHSPACHTSAPPLGLSGGRVLTAAGA